MCEAFIAYDDGDFAKATDLLYPIRYKVVTIGGSNAQVSFGMQKSLYIMYR